MDTQKTKLLNLFRLSEGFTEKELKEAYRDLAHVWHPDKHNHNERLKKKAEDQFKEINEGYEYLKQILKHGETDTSSYSKPNSEDYTSHKSEPQDSASGKKSDHKNEESGEHKEEQAKTKSSSSNSAYLIALVIGGLIFIFVLSQYYSTESTKLDSIEAPQQALRINPEVSKCRGYHLL